MSGDFVKVASQKDIPAGAMKAVEYSEELVCLANIDGTFAYYSNLHPEMNGTITVDHRINFRK